MLGDLGGLGVVLGKWDGGGPWLGCSGRLSVVGSCSYYFICDGVSRLSPPASPHCGGIFLVLNALCIGLLRKNK